MNCTIIQEIAMLATSLGSSLDHLLTCIPTNEVGGVLEGRIQFALATSLTSLSSAICKGGHGARKMGVKEVVMFCYDDQ